MTAPAAAVTTTPERCADCPVPPDGPAEFLWATLGLSILPALGVLLGVSVVYVGRSRFRSLNAETVVAGLSSLAVVTLVLSAMGIVPLGPRFVVTFAVWVVGLSAVGILRSGQSSAESLAAALAVWGLGTATLAVLVPTLEITTAVTTAAIALPGLLLYPLGNALTIEASGRRRPWVAVTVVAMLAAVVAVMSGFVPLPGGPAVLVAPFTAGIFLFEMIAGTPLFALGAQAAE
jgi:hypothetical protein